VEYAAGPVGACATSTIQPVPVSLSVPPQERSKLEPARVPVLRLLSAGVLSAWTLVAADAIERQGWPHFSFWDHVLGALGMYAAVGALLALIVAGLMNVELALVGRRVRASGWRGLSARSAFYGIVGGVSSISTAIWTFSGEHVQKTLLATWGPVFFASALGLATAAGAALLQLALRSLTQGGRLFFAVAALFLAGGCFITRVDLTAFVALYSRVHTILEVSAALCLGAGYALLLTYLARFPGVARAKAGFGVAAGAWLTLTLLLPSLRTWFDESLKHVWLEEVYVGRMLRRIQVAEAFLSDPLHWRGMHMARIERLKARYGLRDLSLSPAWSAPLAEPKETWDALRQLRKGQPRYNVIVFYVDTLRADLALNADEMPALGRFRARSLDFRRSYAVGSDTLRSLPALTGGNYDVLDTQENDLLRVAKRANYDTGLVIAKSAYEFLSKLRPEFNFDGHRVVQDYPAEQQVWGYGAQWPTASKIVDQALEFIDTPRKAPFFLWLFNFDQHNWAQLEKDYVERQANRFGITDDSALHPYRYRAVARTIDQEFQRLLDRLEQRHLLEQTIVLFVSDHGEALGRDGFWVHSVFLWESLLRVPLVLHVPGLPPRVIDNKVSLVDVAPTLGRYMDPTLDGRGFHGEDLLTQLLPRVPPRRFPLLTLSASKDLLVRIGLVDPVDEFKLVLSFEAALPELYDLRATDPDSRNWASEHDARVRRGLNLLVRSPLFPRTREDFELRDTRAQRALELPSEEP
jgi:hypothetical protein